jgi:polyribonucleotide nucleotidyltransferase
VIDLQKKLKSMAGVALRSFDLQPREETIYERVKGIAQEPLKEAFHIGEKTTRRERLEEILQMTFQQVGVEDEASQRMVKAALEEINRKIVRRLILGEKDR